MKLITLAILLFSCAMINSKLNSEKKSQEKSKQIPIPGFNSITDSTTYAYAGDGNAVLQNSAVRLNNFKFFYFIGLHQSHYGRKNSY